MRVLTGLNYFDLIQDVTNSIMTTRFSINGDGTISILQIETPKPPTPHDPDEAGRWRWKMTFVTPVGESEPSDVSARANIVDVDNNPVTQTLDIPVGGKLVSARRLYRTTENNNTFYRVAEIANNTDTTYADSVLDADLDTAHEPPLLNPDPNEIVKIDTDGSPTYPSAPP
jgi:hypothetical protein